MEEAAELAGQIGSSATFLMWIAAGLGAVFLGVLIFDHLIRKKSKSHHGTHSRGLGRTLSRPFRRARDFWRALKELRQQRIERKQWYEPRRHRKSNRAHDGTIRRHIRAD